MIRKHLHQLGYIIKNKYIKTTSENNKCCKDMERLEHLCIAGGNVKWYNHFGKQYDSPIKP